MNGAVVFHSKGKEFPLYKFQAELGIDVFPLESVYELEDYCYEENYLIFCEAKLFYEAEDEIQKRILQSDNFVILTSEFSESYMFDKATKSNCSDFLVTPFGLDEIKLLLKRIEYKKTEN